MEADSKMRVQRGREREREEMEKGGERTRGEREDTHTTHTYRKRERREPKFLDCIEGGREAPAPGMESSG